MKKLLEPSRVPVTPTIVAETQAFSKGVFGIQTGETIIKNCMF